MSLTFQENVVILHALERLKGPGKLLGRLELAVDNGITSLQFSEDEIKDIIKSLDFALEESRNAEAEYYGYFTLSNLAGLRDKIKNFSKVFSVKGA